MPERVTARQQQQERRKPQQRPHGFHSGLLISRTLTANIPSPPSSSLPAPACGPHGRAPAPRAAARTLAW
jgi:hypothetical protein